MRSFVEPLIIHVPGPTPDILVDLSISVDFLEMLACSRLKTLFCLDKAMIQLLSGREQLAVAAFRYF